MPRRAKAGPAKAPAPRPKSPPAKEQPPAPVPKPVTPAPEVGDKPPPPADLGGLMDRLCEARWGVPAAERKRVLREMTDRVLDPGAKPGQKIAAFNSLLAAERLDLEAARLLVEGMAAHLSHQAALHGGSGGPERVPLSDDELAAGIAGLLAPPAEGEAGEGDEGGGDGRGKAVAVPLEVDEVA